MENRTSDLLLRWAQLGFSLNVHIAHSNLLGAFSPLMENGGNGEHRPWMVNVSEAEFVTDVYRFRKRLIYFVFLKISELL